MMETTVVDKTLMEVAEGIAEKTSMDTEEVLAEMEEAGGITLGMLIAMSEPLDD